MKKNILFFILTLVMTAGFTACKTQAKGVPASITAYEATSRPVPAWGPHLSPGMVLVKTGSFLMGSDEWRDMDARPVHKVTLSSFYISKYPVTQAQYLAVTGFNPFFYTGSSVHTPPYLRAQFPEGVTNGDRLPAEQITWFDAVEFCNKLSALEGYTQVYTIRGREPAAGYPIINAEVTADWNANGYRLPTEAEWEYSAKGGDGMGPYFIYSGSNDPETVAWYNSSSDKWAEGVKDLLEQPKEGDTIRFQVASGHYVGSHNRTYPVGGKAPNSLGIYDMSGNVWEWCWDWFGDYADTHQTDPRGPASGDRRVKRGGGASEAGAATIRIASRDYYFPFWWYAYMGIRLVRNAAP